MCVLLVGVEGLLCVYYLWGWRGCCVCILCVVGGPVVCVLLVGVEAQTDSSWSVEGRVWASSGLPAAATEASLYFPKATFRQAQAPPSLFEMIQAPPSLFEMIQAPPSLFEIIQAPPSLFEMIKAPPSLPRDQKDSGHSQFV